MIAALAAITLAGVAGVAVAVSARELRVAVIGLAVTVVASALLLDPLPGPPILGVRIVGGLLAIVLLWVAVADTPRDADAGSRLGWPAEALLVSSAAFAGLGVAAAVASASFAGIGAAADPSDLSRSINPVSLIAMAATASLVAGALPAIAGRTAVRRAIGLILVVHGVVGLRVSLAGAPADLEQLAIAALVIACAATAVGIAGAELPGAELPGAELEAPAGR